MLARDAFNDALSSVQVRRAETGVAWPESASSRAVSLTVVCDEGFTLSVVRTPFLSAIYVAPPPPSAVQALLGSRLEGYRHDAEEETVAALEHHVLLLRHVIDELGEVAASGIRSSDDVRWWRRAVA